MDISYAGKRRGKYLPHLTDTQVNNCFNIFQTSGQPAPNISYSCEK